MSTATGGVLHLLEMYPSHLAINGDMGNTLVLAERARHAGLRVEVHRHDPGDPLPAQVDLITMGSGPVSAVAAIAGDVAAVAASIRDLVAAGTPALFVGAAFQLAGDEITGVGTAAVRGLGVFRQTTDAAAARQVTPAFIVETQDHGRLVGIENHGSITRLAAGQAPFGRALSGRGNTGAGDEGARTAEAIGTHLHGPVLAMNPVVADRMLETAARRRGLEYRVGAEHARLDRLAAATRALLDEHGTEAESAA